VGPYQEKYLGNPFTSRPGCGSTSRAGRLFVSFVCFCNRTGQWLLTEANEGNKGLPSRAGLPSSVSVSAWRFLSHTRWGADFPVCRIASFPACGAWEPSETQPTWKSAIQQVWKPALQCRAGRQGDTRALQFIQTRRLQAATVEPSFQMAYCKTVRTPKHPRAPKRTQTEIFIEAPERPGRKSVQNRTVFRLPDQGWRFLSLFVVKCHWVQGARRGTGCWKPSDENLTKS
jgi:hypothetical protein